MATWNVTITISATPTDITSAVDVKSITRTKRLFTELQPNVNRCDLKVQFSSALWAQLVGASEVSIAITKDGSPYFTGVLSPNYQTEVMNGRSMITMIAEDYTLSRLGKSIAAVTTYASYSVCNPASPSTSLVHAIASAAGVTLAASPPTISSTVPYVCVLPDDKQTWAALLASILFEYGYVYSFLDDGTLSIIQAINTGTITTTNTFSVHPTTGNIRDKIVATKKPSKYDDIRIKYNSVELQTGIVLFSDTSGGDGQTSCKIALNANGDAAGKDYYPPNSGTVEVFSEWRNPDGKQIWIATSVALDSIIPAGVTLTRSLTNYYRRASFSYRNGTGSVVTLTKLRLTGNAYVITAQNVARSTTSGGKVLFEYQANYIFDTTSAQNLAKGINQYWAYSDYQYELKSQANFSLGEYVLLTDSTYMGVSQKCRIIGKTNQENTKSISYTLEAVADYASITITTEGHVVPSTGNAFEYSGFARIPRTLYQRSVTLPATPTGASPSGWQEYRPGGTATLWASDGWVYENGTAIPDVVMSASIVMNASIFMWANTWSPPRQIIETAEILSPRYLGRLPAQPTSSRPGDWWLYYATSDTPTHRGIYQNVNGTPTRVTDDVSANFRMISDAMNDIIWVMNQGTYGVMSDYFTSFTYIENLAANNAFISNLFANLITVQGHLMSLLNTGSGAYIPSADKSKPRVDFDMSSGGPLLTIRDDTINSSTVYRKMLIGPGQGLRALQYDSSGGTETIVHDLPDNSITAGFRNLGHLYKYGYASGIGSINNNYTDTNTSRVATFSSVYNLSLAGAIPSGITNARGILANAELRLFAQAAKCAAGMYIRADLFYSDTYGGAAGPAVAGLEQNAQVSGQDFSVKTKYNCTIPINYSGGVPYITLYLLGAFGGMTANNATYSVGATIDFLGFYA